MPQGRHGAFVTGTPLPAPDLRAVGVGRASSAGAMAGGVPPKGSPFLPTALPPNYAMPMGATPIYAQATATVAGPASWAQPATIITTVPNGSTGVIKDFGLTIQNMLTTTVITYQLLIAGSPAQGGAGSVTLTPHAAQYYETTPFNFNLSVLVPSNTAVGVQITVTDNGTYVVGAYYVGWFAPVAVFNAFQNLGIGG